ncbi:integrase [Cupriavidus sp. UYMMa02A]|nr:integrase [Cupriavidus sp. UYMMa02A]
MRTTHRLTAIGITRLKTPGYYADGANLVLQVSKAGTKSWLFRYTLNGKRREMGLGSCQTVSLSDARERALACRRQLLDGQDPIDTRAEVRRARHAESAKALTFKECATRCISDKRAEWKNAKHAQQWANTLDAYAYPHIGSLDVRSINTGLVRKCLDPIWTVKTETATRLRQRIETVLDWAKVHGYREGDNPAAWRGHLEAVLPKPAKVAKEKNHAALPYSEVHDFTCELQQRPSASSMALEFLILTACRTGEVIGARWIEIDEDAKTWVVPAERMKASKEHVVPLSARALALLKQAKGLANNSEWVFPGASPKRPLSNMAMLELVRGMGTLDAAGEPITVHGFRSTFRQWVAECTAHPREVAEHALAHRLPDKVEAAYQRGTLLEKRRRLMDDWAQFLATKPQLLQHAA